MSFKCIVVHLADDSHHRQRLQLAIDLCKRFGAHLNVVYAKEPLDFPSAIIGRGASLAYLEEVAEMRKEKTAEIAKEVEDLCRDQLKSWEWHEHEGSVEQSVSRFAHLADLVIVEQAGHSHLEDSVIQHLSDYLVVAAGGPMLLRPAEWEGGAIGTRVLVAWKNTRQAITAVRSAQPFLCEADKVFVLADPGDRDVDPPGSDIVKYLGYHGITAEICGASDQDGKGILKTADEQRCDLIVMGAYGHSRLRELIIGGATDHVMRHTPIPVLMRH